MIATAQFECRNRYCSRNRRNARWNARMVAGVRCPACASLAFYVFRNLPRTESRFTSEAVTAVLREMAQGGGK